MREQYDTRVAKHYSAFRPRLHGLVLSRIVHPNESFQTGLNIGCGTGYSALALAEYCNHVFGLDSSQPMLDAAEKHPKITYICGTGDNFSIIPALKFDAITFAGSLFYTKTDRLRGELARSCDQNSVIFVYDFEVLIDDIMDEIGVECPPVSSNYSHTINISDWSEFSTEKTGCDRVAINLSKKELAHILLADSNRFEAFAKRFSDSNPFKSLIDYFKLKETKHQLQAKIYFARYHSYASFRS